MSTTTLDPTHADAALASARPRATLRDAWLGFAVVLVAAVMDLLDSTISQTAAPAIRTDLGGSYADLEWISAAYTLAMAVTLLVGGRLGDLFGRRRVLLTGLAGFAGASTLCAAAPTPELLIAARVLQGAVGAVMIPQGFGLIRELFGDEGQRRAFAVFGPVMGLTAVIGPLAGGGLVDLDVLGLGWRTIFLVNVPLAVVAIALGRRHLPGGAAVAAGRRIDAPSVALAVAGGTALVFPLVQGRELGWPAWCLALPALGVAVLALFAVRQARRVRAGQAPLVEPSILRRGAYVAGLGLVVCFIGAMGGMVLVLNVLFQAGLGRTPLESGVATAAVPLAAIAGTILSSALLERLGRTVLHVGLAVMAAGLAATAVVLHATGGTLSAWDVTAPLAVTGFGMGMIFVPLFDVILAGVAPVQLGSASGLLEAVQQLAMSLGIAVMGTVLFSTLGAAHGPGPFVHAAQSALLVCVGFLAAGFAVTFLLPRHVRR